MRIAFISAMTSHAWGGSEELWFGAARRLAADGHQVGASVKAWPQPATALATLRAEGVEIHERQDRPASSWRSRWQRLQRKAGLGGHPRPTYELWLEAFRPDHVCVSNGNFKDGLWCLESLQRAGISYSSIMQANAEFLWPKDDEADRLVTVYRQAKRVYCVSDANRRLLERQLALRLPQAEVIHNPYQVQRDRVPAWPGATEPFKLACVGRLEPDAKGQDLLFEVLSRPVWRERPLQVSLFGSGAAARSLHRLAEMLDLGDRVRFEGQVSDVGAIWQTHHALVMPSRYEGLPLALVEAMICARMAIVTDVAGNCEVTEDGVSGFVAAAPSVESVADAMERAWAARHQWQAMGKVARERVLELFPADPCRALADRLAALSA